MTMHAALAMGKHCNTILPDLLQFLQTLRDSCRHLPILAGSPYADMT